MRRIYLEVMVWFIMRLRWMKIIPDVWYKSEIDLAKILAKEYGEFFRKQDHFGEDCIGLKSKGEL